ncbi:TonB family protein [Dyadobacter sp. 3J3]|uniref:TonB family protein n=1 Tax=Dyadobacter sp. 3J3 TaxID=2606600 RepID=UPI00135908BA|nr:TonB family protein [Dyadobacter sp. 3J3]
MKSFFLALTLLSFPALSQQIYQVNEVEKPAEPSGGVMFINQFINSNIQIPIRLAAMGMNAKVFVKGVIEPDGSMSGLEVLRSVNKETDAEAIRLLSLYKAWKPALIKDKSVRQATVFPVLFRTNPMPEYDSTSNAIIEYLDKDNLLTRDPKKFKFRNVIPVDVRGFVRDDILYEELRLGKWKTVVKIPFEKKEMWATVSGSATVDSVKAFRISAKMNNYESSYEEMIIQPDGKLLAHSTYPGSGRPPSSGKFYFLNGMLKVEQTNIDSLLKITDWFDNGQIHSIVESGNGKGIIVKNVWERDGTQIVTDGNGWGKINGNPFNNKNIFEEGKVLNGSKSGRWTSKWGDSTLVYDEFYENGKLVKGIKQDKTEYSLLDDQPAQFKGGPSKLFQFLGTNIQYPYQASLHKITGRVVVSFVILEDGTLTDYKIEKSVEKSLDEEALRVVKKSSGMWEAGTMRGDKVKIRYTLPINFATN